jgi:hypothetical protein
MFARALALAAIVLGGCSGLRVVTQHNNTLRTGANLLETELGPSTLGGFGRLYTRDVSGYIVAQPLYVEGVRVGGVRRNLVYVATMTNDLYAFDADDFSPSSSTPALLHRHLDEAPTVPDIGYPMFGITSTPVIDADAGVLYVISTYAKNGCTPQPAGWPCYGFHLWKLVLADLSSLGSSPIDIQASVTAAGATVTMAPLLQLNRPGLLLSQGVLYAAFGNPVADHVQGYEGQAHGWVLAWDAASLAPAGAFCTTPTTVPTPTNPNGEGWGGVWQAGNGLAADAQGNLYFTTGNGPFFEDARMDFGDSIVKLSPATGGALVHSGHYSPPNRAFLGIQDLDLGSGGVLLLPNQRLIAGGKEGILYLLNTADMSLVQSFRGAWNTYQNVITQDQCVGDCCTHQGCDNVISSYPHIHGSPIYWSPDSAGQYGYVYLWAEKDYLRAYRYNARSGMIELPAGGVSDASGGIHGALAAPPPTEPRGGMPGGMLSLSANVTGDAIVWALIPRDGEPVPGERNLHAVLRAYAALPSGNQLQQLWNSDTSPADRLDYFSRFAPPTVVAGKVFAATLRSGQLNSDGRLAVFGRLHATIPSQDQPSLPVQGNTPDPATPATHTLPTLTHH